MKPVWWIIIGITLFTFPLVLVGIVSKVIYKASWWWLGGTAIFEFIVLVLVGIGFLIWFIFFKKKIEQTKIGIESAKQKAVMQRKYDEDEPDNFMIDETILMRVGESGKERTPILWLKGKGTEMSNNWSALINLNNVDNEISWLKDKTDDYIERIIKSMAMNPEHEVKEERILGLDDFGRPTTTIKTIKASQAEIKEEIAKKEAQEGVKL